MTMTRKTWYKVGPLKARQIVHNSFWIKKNRASDNEGKFHTYLKCRIWICNKKFNFSLDIRVSMNLAFFEKIWLFLSTLALATTGYKTEPQFFVPVLPVQECSKRAKNSPIFSIKCQIHDNSDVQENLNFLLQIQILHFKYVWNLPSLSLARFYLIQNELRTMCPCSQNCTTALRSC